MNTMVSFVCRQAEAAGRARLANPSALCYNTCVNPTFSTQSNNFEGCQPGVALDAARVPPNANVSVPVSANAAPTMEPTRSILWQLPDEPRLHVTRGGRRRDWRAGLSLLGGLSALALLLVTLMRWPRTTVGIAADAPPLRPAFAPSTSILASAAGAGSAMPVYPGAINAPVGLRASYRPLPGFAALPAYPARSPYVPANVLPAAPTAIGPPIVHYSY